jgi:hypothetical protein
MYWIRRYGSAAASTEAVTARRPPYGSTAASIEYPLRLSVLTGRGYTPSPTPQPHPTPPACRQPVPQLGKRGSARQTRTRRSESESERLGEKVLVRPGTRPGPEPRSGPLPDMSLGQACVFRFCGPGRARFREDRRRRVARPSRPGRPVGRRNPGLLRPPQACAGRQAEVRAGADTRERPARLGI